MNEMYALGAYTISEFNLLMRLFVMQLKHQQILILLYFVFCFTDKSLKCKTVNNIRF